MASQRPLKVTRTKDLRREVACERLTHELNRSTSGGFIHPAAKVSSLPGGECGLFASDDLSSDALVMRVPLALAVTPDAGRRTFLGKALFKRYRGVTEYHRRLLKEKDQVAAVLGAYFAAPFLHLQQPLLLVMLLIFLLFFSSSDLRDETCVSKFPRCFWHWPCFPCSTFTRVPRRAQERGAA